MKLIIAGGRDFNDYTLLRSKLDHLLQNIPTDNIEIVSGGARGADSLGEQYANGRGIKVKQFTPEWKNPDGTVNRAAGHIRNRKMGDYADTLVAFWDGQSKGTKGMIDYAIKKGLSVRVVRYALEN